MSDKLSDHLQDLLQNGSVRTVPVTVLLHADLTGKRLKNAVQKIESQMEDAEYLDISGTVHGQMRLSGVKNLSELPEVESIDVERDAPISELIDPT
jgi:hypothetical protein